VNSLENFRAITEHGQPDRIPYYASFTEDLQRRVIDHIGKEDIAGHYGFFSTANLGIKRPEDLPDLDYSPYWEGEELPDGTTIDAHGVAMVPSGFYHFWGYISPLRNASSLEELESYPLDDMSDWDFSYMNEIVEKAHDAGKVVVGWVGHMYETAWQIRGYEQFLMDMVERPAWAECLLERLFEQNMIRATAYARAGADLIRCGDDVANQNTLMFSPGLWKKMMLSRWGKVWAAVKDINPQARIWYHSDGNIEDIIPHLLDAGVDILNPLQPECMNIDRVYDRYGERVTFDGLMGTQSTMPFGTPDDVCARVKEIIDKYGQNGGLIISPTHVLEPEVPVENIDAFAEACREYGKYTKHKS